ncbi:alpha/beta fold hydrolase [Anaeromyxobacter oryzae]|uniref:Alpha/beta hydrolase n=1 Tax=Anaeromyxobacter oryzae TaxID=2918170 RepID=A0ABM7WP60_9BACT|nr:alpha/beta fold hydrolase [Anaeromyxobacter oryzae]BDG01255.1 alpha/beta hydrolase [Anaeromyxobacter oryzae]
MLLSLPRSPMIPDRSPVHVHVRARGAGPAVVLLHGGWGYEAYPFDSAIDALAPSHRVLAPDRVGYGRSDRVAALPRGFHRLMAEETLLVLDALGVRDAALWGHSDGAVIAAWAAILAPDRVRALVLEAVHVVAAKPASVEFFETGVTAPERFGAPVVEALERDHGASWREVIAAGGRAWLDIISEGGRGRADLHDGRLREIRAPTLLLHGRHDPRTEPGELDAARAALPGATLELLDAGHAPHASARAGARAVEVAAAFLARHRVPA